MTTLVLSILNGSSLFLYTISTNFKAWMSLNFGKIQSLTSELAALERQKNLGSKFSRIRPGTYVLPALERLEKSP